MRTAKLYRVALSIAALGLWACSGGSSTGTTGTGSGGTTTGGGTSGGTSGTGGTSGGDAGPPGIGISCNLATSPDPCLVNGLVCKQLSDGSVSCQLPGELDVCIRVPGCAPSTPDLHCQPGFMIGSSSVDLCVYYCNDTTDCPNILTSCQGASPKYCFDNQCGPGSAPSNGTSYYGKCNSAGSGDGTCIPFNKGQPGRCSAKGSVALWQPCGDSRIDGGTSDVCVANATCNTFTAQDGSTKKICTPLCAPVGATAAGPACATGQTCFSSGPSTDFGFCLIDCGAGQQCPSSLGCLDISNSLECLP